MIDGVKECALCTIYLFRPRMVFFLTGRFFFVILLLVITGGPPAPQKRMWKNYTLFATCPFAITLLSTTTNVLIKKKHGMSVNKKSKKLLTIKIRTIFAL